ncbi:MAG: sulfur carrier protein ThiS [Muribaculaceae bacterium]|nr:sulfur carrier protein ThiS [Muribaculaceae bacterium]MDE7110454.1 sulfur carrier protein ThiS [Muribaculaceae bacterium]
MTVYLNEKPIMAADLTPLAVILQQQGISPAGKAVALNEIAIPPSLWAETLLHDGDKILVFRAFYGG